MSRQKLPPSLKSSPCILHIDLEQVRLGLSSDVPVAVQQWEGLIAVNYPARAAGITRHMPIDEAFKKCPNLQTVHVATFNMHDPVARYNSSPSQLTHKVSLDVYRKASLNIFKIFQSHCDKVQKAGLDEAFLDVTDIVNARLVERYAAEISEDATEEFPYEIDWNPLGFLALSDEESELLNPTTETAEVEEAISHLIASDKSPPAPKLKGTWKDLQLSIGAEVAKEIREDIFKTLQYTCSAGIAHNKTVAKLCSALNKPNKQTSMRESIVLEFMNAIPFTKIRNLGGKLGNEVENALNIQTAGDLWKFSLEELQAKFGQAQGLWLYDICRGKDTSEVTKVKFTKSMMASKQFTPPLRLVADVERWMSVLGSEIYMRIMDDFEERSRWPKTLVLHYRSGKVGSGRSKSCPMVNRADAISPDVITQRANELFKTCERPFPLLHLSLTVSGLSVDESSTTHNITKFFTNSSDGPSNISTASPLESNDRTIDADTIRYEKVPKTVTRNITTFFANSSDGSSNTSTTSPLETKAKSSGTDLLRYNNDPKTESKAKAISALFFSQTNVGSTDVGDKEGTTRCDECGNWVSMENVAEHSDYHFAKKLQEEDRQANSQNRTTVKGKASTTNKKRKSPSHDDEAQNESRRLFFQPRRS